MRKDLLPETFEGRLSKVVEECGEVLQAIGKLQRFGKRAIDKKTRIKYNNVKDAVKESRQLIMALDDFISNSRSK